MKLQIYSLEGCPYSIKSEAMLKLCKPEIIKVSQYEKDKYKTLNKMDTFPQIFLIDDTKKIKIGGLNDTIDLLNQIYKINNLQKNIKYTDSDMNILKKFFSKS
jgi:glutaredoxin